MLARHTNSRVHVAHVSTAGSVEVIRWAKAQGIDVTAEVTPHHLLLTTDLLAGYDPVYKVNPPLRPDEDVAAPARRARRRHHRRGRHRPRAARAPRQGACVRRRAFGMLGLETALSVVSEVMVDSGAMAWADVARVMSQNPARIAGLDGHGGALAVGAAGQHHAGRPAGRVVGRPRPPRRRCRATTPGTTAS